MGYYIGIDGGGTKTDFALADETGIIRKNLRKGGTSYKHVGWEATLSRVEEGVKELLSDITCEKEEVFICFGAPNYGESKKFDRKLEVELKNLLKGYHLKIVNDCEVGWAGSLGGKPGINIVAGTGSIGFGKDKNGKTVSAGGWSDFFGDEGSCRWLGVKTMELFSKQADGRIPKGPLYDVVMEAFSLEDSMDIIDVFERDYQPYRDKLASLQVLLLKAAKKGDKSACEYYKKAAIELALIIKAIYHQLEFENTCEVSYSGGLFRAEEIILVPLLEELNGYNIKISKPLHSPVTGAVLLACEQAGGKLCI